MHLRFLHIFSCLGQFIPCQCLIIFRCLDVLQFSYPSIDLKRLTHSLMSQYHPIYTIAIQTSSEDLNTLLFPASVFPYKLLLPRPILPLAIPHSSFRAQLYKCYLLWEIFQNTKVIYSKPIFVSGLCQEISIDNQNSVDRALACLQKCI